MALGCLDNPGKPCTAKGMVDSGRTGPQSREKDGWPGWGEAVRLAFKQRDEDALGRGDSWPVRWL